MTREYQKRQAAANVFNQQNIAPQFELEQRSGGTASAPPSSQPSDLAGSMARRRVSEEVSRPAKPVIATADLLSSEELQLQKEPIQVREVGFWPFKHVIVPPNVYVVQTRLGKSEPIKVGLGLSFAFNPYTDAYLVVPAAMQTIGIVANSISSEKQGINVLAYVQWQINDFGVAYRKLDFSDSRDPLGIVNAQLREQAEAAIKDKIATMRVDEVLTDKQPIIEELTARLKSVAEGRGNGNTNEGLGIKIVTVQIKEAYVSSLTLWEHLQAPFRHTQEKIARISHLVAAEEIRTKELENRKLAETSEAETMVQVERIKQNTQTDALQTRLAQETARLTHEQESERKKIELAEQTVLYRQESDRRLQLEAATMEQERKLLTLRRSQEEAIERARLLADAGAQQKALQIEQALKEMDEETRLAEKQLEAAQERIARETQLKQAESELAILLFRQETRLQRRQQESAIERNKLEQVANLELEETSATLRLALAEREVEVARLRQEVQNLVNENSLAVRVIEQLPELAAQMPDVHELKVLQMGEGNEYNSLASFLGRIMAIVEGLKTQMTKKDGSV